MNAASRSVHRRTTPQLALLSTWTHPPPSEALPSYGNPRLKECTPTDVHCTRLQCNTPAYPRPSLHSTPLHSRTPTQSSPVQSNPIHPHPSPPSSCCHPRSDMIYHPLLLITCPNPHRRLEQRSTLSRGKRSARERADWKRFSKAGSMYAKRPYHACLVLLHRRVH